MPWCPKCASEYREGFRRCKDCDVDLVKDRPDPQTLAQANTKRESWTDQYQWVKLANVRDDHEADVLEGLLADGGIPVTRRASGEQQVMEVISGSAIGIDVFVPASMRVDALELLKERADLQVDDATLEELAAQEPLAEDEEEADSKGGLYVVLFLILFVAAIWWSST